MARTYGAPRIHAELETAPVSANNLVWQVIIGFIPLDWAPTI